MRLYLVRHAQSEANAGLPGASRDCSLTDFGRRQAEAVAQRLARHRIDRVLASPYVRTLETAEAIRQATGAPASVFPLLHEHQVRPFEVDDWPLLSRAALGERFPAFALPPDFAFDPRWHDAPETEAGVLRRAGQVVMELWHTYAAAPDGDQQVRLVLVSHGSPTAKLVLASLGLLISPEVDVQLQIDNASLSSVEYFPAARQLLGLNRVEHLTPLQEAL
jgi:2,3-bisphosphoglycerate-dependent phosphoglycerate mutase